ncbi:MULTISPECIES: GDP-L-fucose synthase family protein [unclassified Rhizobium]|uniref:GDP-L-fucose synthase family protein n=1 Tax=unclassified Rhizobium TaxID=2613769 RepID=UPI000714EECC|nr:MULTISPECIES: GDP-L-fucose synthase [unclassified Rhizobium]KQT04777.1 GDP-fucose synthetase [Rhizobium sp. Leaf386]KQT05143.1 GDP-fucose synthetase [Rhizobium sp. Leaf391]KQU02129.1 GDP-fucose synthetase [Rhizobium sp. Leaf453]
MTFMDDTDVHPFSLIDKNVWVAGHAGMVGSALVRRLERERCTILTESHDSLDLTRQADTEDWMKSRRPQAIFIAAARVGGIVANSRYPADFLYINAMIAFNVMKTAADIGVEKLLWIGSSCIYPKFADQPIRETALLSGRLEVTNEAYSVAKIAGIKLAEAYKQQHGKHFLSVMPTNLYGPGDNFDLETAHVLPALIRKMHEAKISGRNSVVLWGTGTPMREFLHVDDMADACVHLMKCYDEQDIVNIGSGDEISIRDLATVVAKVVGYQGHVVCDASKPDGTPRKLVDASKLRSLGWTPSTRFMDGVHDVYMSWQRSGYATRAANG